jgi:hypothetical protein
VAVVLADSPDVMDSVGRPGFLPERLRASNPNAPRVEIVTIPGERCDVMAQRLLRSVDPLPDAPPGLENWLAAATARHVLPAEARVVVISMSEAMTASVVRHRDDGWLLQLPEEHETTWRNDHLTWIEQCFVPEPPDMATLRSSLTAIEEELERIDAACIVFGVSTYTPEERIYWFDEDHEEPAAIKANRINLLLDTLDEDSKLSVVPVDRIVAEYGAADAVVGHGRYSAETSKSIADEAATQIAARPRIATHFSPETMRLTVPRYDRRTQGGTLLTWHVAAPSAVDRGDVLFDVRFEHLHTRLNAAIQRESERALSISVVATRAGFLQEQVVAAGGHVEVGTTVGVFTTEKDASVGSVADAPAFPVGVKLVTQ